MRTKRTSMRTDPPRYAKQLVHWAARGPVTEEEGATVVRWETGQVITLHPVDGALDVQLSLTDDAVGPARADRPSGPADLDSFAEVVAAHLERFGQRDELHVWDERRAQRSTLSTAHSRHRQVGTGPEFSMSRRRGQSPTVLRPAAGAR
jgi:hypothetical protein